MYFNSDRTAVHETITEHVCMSRVSCDLVLRCHGIVFDGTRPALVLDLAKQSLRDYLQVKPALPPALAAACNDNPMLLHVARLLHRPTTALHANQLGMSRMRRRQMHHRWGQVRRRMAVFLVPFHHFRLYHKVPRLQQCPCSQTSLSVEISKAVTGMLTQSSPSHGQHACQLGKANSSIARWRYH